MSNSSKVKIPEFLKQPHTYIIFLMVVVAFFQVLGKLFVGTPSDVKTVLVEQIVIDGEIGIVYASPTKVTVDIRKIGSFSTLYLKSKNGGATFSKPVKEK